MSCGKVAAFHGRNCLSLLSAHGTAGGVAVLARRVLVVNADAAATAANLLAHEPVLRQLGYSNLRFCHMNRFLKRLNWPAWAGFVLNLVAGFSYPFLFVRWPITREFPWANLLLFVPAMVLLFVGLRRAFRPGKGAVSKIFSSLAAALGLSNLAALLFVVFVAGSWLPASAGAPQVGQKAPDFTLSDTNNKPVALAQLLAEPVNNRPPRGVLLVFYRGYW